MPPEPAVWPVGGFLWGVGGGVAHARRGCGPVLTSRIINCVTGLQWDCCADVDDKKKDVECAFSQSIHQRLVLGLLQWTPAKGISGRMASTGGAASAVMAASACRVFCDLYRSFISDMYLNDQHFHERKARRLHSGDLVHGGMPNCSAGRGISVEISVWISDEGQNDLPVRVPTEMVMMMMTN